MTKGNLEAVEKFDKLYKDLYSKGYNTQQSYEVAKLILSSELHKSGFNKQQSQGKSISKPVMKW